jgi:hypothetical protein
MSGYDVFAGLILIVCACHVVIGAFGKVLMVRNRIDKEIYAMKVRSPLTLSLSLTTCRILINIWR